MWIDTLKLRNFRGFRELDLDLGRQLTVLIGVNGSGKSTIVRALEVCSVAAADRRFGWSYLEHRNLLREEDIRAGEASAFCTIEYGDETLAVGWQSEAGLVQPRDSGPIEASSDTDVPLVVCFPVGRQSLFTPRPRGEGGKLLASARMVTISGHPAFDDLQGFSTPFEFFEWWFRQQEDLENQRRVEAKNLDATDPALEFVRTSVQSMIPELSGLRIDRYRPVGRGRSQLIFEKGEQTLSAEMLSDGEKSLIVLATTIARRVALIDYGVEVPMAERQATIVIDEIELHLHPSWQRVVIPRLLKAFPNCQFVITTHSPQVIGSVDVESLFILEDFQVRPAKQPTKGRDSNAILEEIMGATARDPETETELDQAARLVEIGSDAEAEAAVQRLAARFGDDDREVVRLRTALMLRGA